MGPAHRHRQLKEAPVVRPAFARGHRNDGHIEIEFNATDDEVEPGFYEQREFGHVYKLPEDAVKLDFISR